MEVGAFVFRDEGDGVIVGKYTHYDNDKVYTECAKVDGDQDQMLEPFEGRYRTVWIEKGASQGEHTLAIKQVGADEIYKLAWWNGTTLVFYGEAMLFNGMLTGWYTTPNKLKNVDKRIKPW